MAARWTCATPATARPTARRWRPRSAGDHRTTGSTCSRSTSPRSAGSGWWIPSTRPGHGGRQHRDPRPALGDALVGEPLLVELRGHALRIVAVDEAQEVVE